MALALMLSWGYQGAQEAAADATTEVEFSISAPGCDTNNIPEADTCTFPVGSSFTLEMSWNGFSGGHAGNAENVGMQIRWTGAVSGPNIANGKSLTNALPSGCIFSSAIVEPGGDPTRARIECFIFFDPTISTGLMGSAEFNCDTAGVGTITLEHGSSLTAAIDPALVTHWEDITSVDTLTVNCAEAPGDITGKWNVTFTGSVTQISCAYQVTQSGTSLTAVDPNCDFSPLTGNIDTGTGVFFLFLDGFCGGELTMSGTVTGGGTSMSGTYVLIDFCNAVFDNNGTFAGAIKAPSQINITNLAQYALPKTCFDVRDDAQNPLFTVCDNDFQGPPASHPACDDGTDTICNDEDPADGLIRVTTVTGDYRVAVSKPAVNHTVDPSKQPCVAVPAGKCEVTFVNAPNSRPWFPWDLPEPKLNIEPDGNVNIIDIGIIVRHFLDKKPLP